MQHARIFFNVYSISIYSLVQFLCKISAFLVLCQNFSTSVFHVVPPVCRKFNFVPMFLTTSVEFPLCRNPNMRIC